MLTLRTREGGSPGGLVRNLATRRRRTALQSRLPALCSWLTDGLGRREGLAVSGHYMALAIDANAPCDFEAAARYAVLAAADEHELGRHLGVA